MTATYTALATTTLTTSTTAIDFTSISGTYTDLVLIITGQRASGNPSAEIQFNSDTGSNYSMTNILGNGSSVATYAETNQTSLNQSYFTTSGSGSYSTWLTNIMNYSNTTTYKTVLSSAGEALSGSQITVGTWRSTAAITAIKIKFGGSVAYLPGSTFTLYGIKAE